MNYTVKFTGEELEFPSGSFAEIVESYRLASEYMKAYEAVKKELAKLAEPFIGPNGISEPVNGYMFRSTAIQRMNYDKSVLREVLDEDTYDQFMEPNKTALDRFLKENIERLGEASTLIRKSMVAVGNPYQVTRLEKVER